MCTNKSSFELQFVESNYLDMAIKKLLFLVVSTVLLGAAKVHAQTNKGKDFWLAELPNVECYSNFATAVANPSVTTANVVIDHPATSTSILVVISPRALETTRFPCRATSSTGTFTNPVYHVTSDVDVVVYDFIPIDNVFTNDAALVLPASQKRPHLSHFHRRLGLN